MLKNIVANKFNCFQNIQEQQTKLHKLKVDFGLITMVVKINEKNDRFFSLIFFR